MLKNGYVVTKAILALLLDVEKSLEVGKPLDHTQHSFLLDDELTTNGIAKYCAKSGTNFGIVFGNGFGSLAPTK